MWSISVWLLHRVDLQCTVWCIWLTVMESMFRAGLMILLNKSLFSLSLFKNFLHYIYIYICRIHTILLFILPSALDFCTSCAVLHVIRLSAGITWWSCWRSLAMWNSLTSCFISPGLWKDSHGATALSTSTPERYILICPNFLFPMCLNNVVIICSC